jgi:hypothetical protein
MSITKTITVRLPALPEGYELCERPINQKGCIAYSPIIGWASCGEIHQALLLSDLAIFARPIAKKMRRMTMAELSALVPAGLYYRWKSEDSEWYLVASRAIVLNILGAEDSVISTDGMNTWRKPEVEVSP